MADKRMFNKLLVDSDKFLDMPLTTQAFYFHLCLRADDEGFINSPKKIMRMTGARDDDLKILISKKFIMPFPSGVVAVKHWLVHNKIRNERIKTTLHKKEKEQINIIDNVYDFTNNGEYCLTDVSQQSDKCQNRLDKIRLDKNKEKKKNESHVFDENSIEYKLSLSLFDLMQKNLKSKRPNLNNWSKDIKAMINIDERSIKDIECVIKYSQTNDFWKSNIRSASKLRKQFDVLYLQSQKNNNKGEIKNDEYKEIYEIDFSQHV